MQQKANASGPAIKCSIEHAAQQMKCDDPAECPEITVVTYKPCPESGGGGGGNECCQEQTETCVPNEATVVTGGPATPEPFVTTLAVGVDSFVENPFGSEGEK